MIPCLRVKDGVQFAIIAPGGFTLLSAFWHAAQTLGHDLTITSGTDGVHSGTDDPHHLGRAYDIRTQGYDAPGIVSAVMNELLVDMLDKITPTDGGFVTRYFFGWVEDAGQANEHAHFQVRRGVTYPPNDTVVTA